MEEHRRPIYKMPSLSIRFIYGFAIEQLAVLNSLNS